MSSVDSCRRFRGQAEKYDILHFLSHLVPSLLLLRMTREI